MRTNWTAILSMALAIGALTAQAQPGSAESRNVTCKGKIIGEQGNPIGGAKVTLHEMVYSETRHKYEPKLLGQMQTQIDGAFSFSETTGTDSYRYGYIIAVKEGLAPGVGNWRMHDGDKEIEISLGAPGRLAGMVVDESDRPVPGARVSVSLMKIGDPEDERGLSGDLTANLFASTTSATGRFTLTGMPTNAMAELIIRKPGRATISTYRSAGFSGQKLTYAPGQTGIKLVQPAEARIEGVVVEQGTGKPVPGVLVAAVGTNDLAYFRRDPALSDADGRFSFDTLPSNLHTLSLVKPRQGLPEWVARPVEATTEAGKIKSDVTLKVTKGGILEVVVTDAISRQPIENASVAFREETGGQYRSSRCDKNGVARVRLMPGDYVWDGAYKQGYSRQRLQDTITIEEGKTERIEHEMVSQPKVRGIVRNQAGRPVEGAKLKVCPSGRENIVTDSEGRFEAICDPGGMPSGRTPVMFLVCRYEKDNQAAAVEVEEGARTVDIKLEPAATLIGRVTDPDGKGIAGAKLNVQLRESNWGSPISRDQMTTDKQGKFEIKAVPGDREYSLYTRADGYGETRTEGISTDGAADSRVDVETIVLSVADLSISGIAVDSGGKPVAGARIYCSGDNQPHRGAQTGVDGKFTLEQVCSGKIRVSASKYGAVQLYGSVETEGGATDVKVIIGQRSSSSSTRYVPKRPPSLVNRPLPELKDVKVDLPSAATSGKMMLVCFFDVEQRPSRRYVTQLAKQAGQLAEKGVAVVVVQASKLDQNKISDWVKKYGIPFPVGLVQGEEEKSRFTWGVRSLPWLILTDRKHVVRTAGFSLGDLEQKIRENRVLEE